jgi:hypothetical protein
MIRDSIYYLLKPYIPRKIQLYVRRWVILKKWPHFKDLWPIDERAGKKPVNWQGWPEGKEFALVLTHDIENEKGQKQCTKLANLEKEMGFRSSFNFVPKRYLVSPVLRSYLVENGFEVGVHDFNHDGRLFSSRRIFENRVPHINRYLREWNAVGFRAGAMHHNLKWIGELDLEYDCSTFDTDPFEPQPDGVRTIFPFWVPRESKRGGYVELPYTIPQDFTVQILLRDNASEVWKNKLDWIIDKGGMALINIHPDYIHFGKGKPGNEEYSISKYEELLSYASKKYRSRYWNVLPKEVASFIKSKIADKMDNGNSNVGKQEVA